jgi:hypothetical protein
MDRTLRNTLAVLLVTAFTALAIFATVQLSSRLVTDTAVASAPLNAASALSGTASSDGLLVCPRTGCTATSCHALR